MYLNGTEEMVWSAESEMWPWLGLIWFVDMVVEVGGEEEEEEGMSGWLGSGCSERTQTLPWGQGLFVLADTFLTAVIQSFSSWLATTPPHFLPSIHPSLLKAAKTLRSCLLFSLSHTLSFYLCLLISLWFFFFPSCSFSVFFLSHTLCISIHITSLGPKM